MKHLRWGILGSGHIATKFAAGLNTITAQATAQAVGSRSLAKAKAFAAEHNIARAYGSYDEVLADPDVDIVYIALPNHLHAHLSIQCAQAKKHILCEKPVTLNAAQLEEVLEVVRAQDVFFMEAFMYRCHQQWDKVREILAAGTIGEVRMLHSVFAYNMGEDAEDIRLEHAMGGGGLMDVGCYPVSFSRMIAAEEPTEFYATGVLGPTSRVDEWGAATLKFPSGIIASMTFALRCNVPRIASIYGTRGIISLPEPWQPYDENAAVVLEAGGKVEKFDITTGRHLYANEALAVAEYIDARQCPAMDWNDSLGQARTMDALRSHMGLRWDIEEPR